MFSFKSVAQDIVLQLPKEEHTNQEPELAFEILNTKFIEDVNECSTENALADACLNDENKGTDDEDQETLELLKSAALILDQNNNNIYLNDIDFETIHFLDKHDKSNSYFVETSTPANEYDRQFKPVDFHFKPSDDAEIHHANNVFNFNLNDYVSINERKYGILRYIGLVHFKHGTFCGIELDESEGKHDGKIDNIR